MPVLAEEQVASTDNRFNMAGHGSAPKVVFDMVTRQLSCPMHFCEIHDVKERLVQFFLTEDLQVCKTTTRSHILQKK